MHHTVAISDIHLSENEPGDGLWMRYRQAPYAPDAEIAAMLAAIRAEAEAGGGERAVVTLVLNGDVFDFDAPRVRDGASVFHDDPRDAAHDAPATERILDDHPVFVDAMGEHLAAGHRVVMISGNHDAQVTLPEVREVVRRRFVDAALRRGASGSPSSERRAAIEARVEFRAWFYLTGDGVLIEHGHQYDPYCAYRYPVEPYEPHAAGTSPVIKPTMGSLATRLLTGRMGYFNPHVDRTYTLGAAGYFRHWLRRYLFSRHSLGFAWFFGSLRTAWALLRARDPGDERRARCHRAAAAEEAGVALERIDRHAELFASPAEEGMRRVLRELYLDRTALIAVCVLFALAWWAIGVDGTWWVPFTVALVAFVNEARLPGATVGDRWRGVDDAMERVAAVHGARAVLFGHTHHPHGRFTEGGQFFANLGTWSSAYLDLECTQPAYRERSLVWLRSDGDKLEGGLYAWIDGRLEPRVVGEIDAGPRVSGSTRSQPVDRVTGPLPGVELPRPPDSLEGMISPLG